MVKIPGVKRAIQDVKHYDPPDRVWSMFNSKHIDYAPSSIKSKYPGLELRIRDVALMSIVYLTASRIREIVGGEVIQDGEVIGEIDPIRLDQFVDEGQFLLIRDIPILKQKYVNRGGAWVPITSPEMYPKRIEIPIPKSGKLGKFTHSIRDHLENREGEEYLFNIGRVRGYQIFNEITGMYPHYFRDMGLKLWNRIFDNVFKLKQFSGHKRWDSLEKYMYELSRDDFRKAIELT